MCAVAVGRAHFMHTPVHTRNTRACLDHRVLLAALNVDLALDLSIELGNRPS